MQMEPEAYNNSTASCKIHLWKHNQCLTIGFLAFFHTSKAEFFDENPNDKYDLQTGGHEGPFGLNQPQALINKNHPEPPYNASHQAEHSEYPGPGGSKPAEHPEYPGEYPGSGGSKPAEHPEYPGSGGSKPAEHPEYPGSGGSKPAEHPEYPGPGSKPAGKPSDESKSDGYTNDYNQWNELVQEELSVNAKSQADDYDKELSVEVTIEVGDWPEIEGDQTPHPNLNKEKIKRWDYKEKLREKELNPNHKIVEPDGCGKPICTIIDQRPIRYMSMCHLVQHMKDIGMHQRILHVQKGDCADAIENKLLDQDWGSKPGSCEACKNDKEFGCATQVCVVSTKTKIPKQYDNICEFYKYLNHRTYAKKNCPVCQPTTQQNDLKSVYIGLGTCDQLFGLQAELQTEWFDIDEPCMYGDTEDVTQNLAYVNTYPKSAPFRMCAKVYRTRVEFQTVHGRDLNQDKQKLHVDYDKEHLVCLNKEQLNKPPPPDYWFHKKIKCMDYKMKHTCKCLYGCPERNRYPEAQIQLPSYDTLFEECEWRPFVDTQTPDNSTWDVEERGQIIAKSKNNILSKHVCGGNKLDAMYIDTRTVDEDVPWHEVNQLMTKNTPLYGSMCINKNNLHYNKICKDYKTRFCCAKQPQSQWGKWSPWGECSVSCGGGIKSATRQCKEVQGAGTCFGNWVDKVDGVDQWEKFKKKYIHCNPQQCPVDSKFLPWTGWSCCSTTCGPGVRSRSRDCLPAVGPGQECPNPPKQVEKEDCVTRKCAVPTFTPWTPWSACSVPCGVGKKTRTRKCVDKAHHDKVLDRMECLSAGSEPHLKTFYFQEDKCDMGGCAVDGNWGPWGEWEKCNIKCGPGGKRIRRRYCVNPMPEEGGKDCEGPSEEYEPCKDLPPCPINCQLSQWGAWTPCSITCGKVGTGLITRNRHVATPAQFGGQPCPKDSLEQRIPCPHKDETDLTPEEEKIAIPQCPVDCKYGPWGPMSPCMPIPCFGEKTGYTRDSPFVKGLKCSRMRPIAENARFGGKPCDMNTLMEEKQCDYSKTPDCDKIQRTTSRWGEWGEWSDCAGACGKRGQMRRERACIEGDDKKPCEGEREDERLCPNHCPSTGWAPWEHWSNCPVTCGKGRVFRNRKCQDDHKTENQHGDMPPCGGKKIEKESRDCDLGPCGSLCPTCQPVPHLGRPGDTGGGETPPTEDPYKEEPVPKLPFEEHPHPYKEESVPKLPLESHPYKEEPAVYHGRNGKRRNRRT